LAITFSEKTVKYSLQKLLNENKILWFHKFEQMNLGMMASAKFMRTKAPLDFLAVLNDNSTVFIEVKETQGTNLSIRRLSDSQQELLKKLNSFLLIRFYNKKFYRNDIGFYEYWVLYKFSKYTNFDAIKSFKMSDFLKKKEGLGYEYKILSVVVNTPEKRTRKNCGKEFGMTEHENIKFGIGLDFLYV